MSSFVRSSKYRHVFCDPARPDGTWQNIRLSTVTGEQNYIKANAKYFAVGLQGGGGPFAVMPLSKPGRFEAEQPVITGHSAPVLDFDFNPFNDEIVASCSEDQTIKIWGIPEGGLTVNLETPLVDLHGHSRKVTLLSFHPTASNVLASVGADQAVKLWDIEKGSEINTLVDVHEQLIQDIVWDYTGTHYATSSKDKNVRIHDARSARVTETINTAHEGVKSIKLTYLGPMEKLVTVGFTRQSQRQFKVWDPRKTDQELKRIDVDQAAGVIMPFFDPDTNLLYLAGKGDGNIRYYEMANENPYCYSLSEHRSSVSAKGMAWVPKKGLNVMACETARLLKLTTSSVEPMSFFVPRKSEAFQDDIYPDTYAGVASHTADEWYAGSVKPPRLMSLNPATSGRLAPAVAGSHAAPVAAPVKTTGQLKAELEAANARIRHLEEKLQAAGISTD
jgi:coronin-1B/1C/6